MAFHGSAEHSPQSSRVILKGHNHNGSEMLRVGPLRKHLTFISGSIDFGDLHDSSRQRPSVGESALPLHPHREALGG